MTTIQTVTGPIDVVLSPSASIDNANRLDAGEIVRYRSRGRAALMVLANRVRRQGK